MDELGFQGGDVVDSRFRLIQPVGIGAFAAVWSGVDLTDGRSIAMKILHQDLADHPYAILRFQREIEVLQKLDHPNIARPISAGSDARCRYLAMQFVEGQTLFDNLIDVATRGDRYSISEILAVGRGITAALDHAHGLGIIHRDLKPPNVMVQRKNGVLVPTILDFGIAKVAAELSDQTTLGRRLGTLMYMSPEQLRGEPVEARADVFAAGVILFEMLTLRRPFARDENDQPVFYGGDPPRRDLNGHATVMKRIAVDPRLRPSVFRQGLGARVDEVVLRALDHAPKNRYGSAGELLHALEAALEDRGSDAPPMVETGVVESPDLTKVAPRPLTSIEPAPTARLVRPRRRIGLWAVLFTCVMAGSAAFYLEASEPIEIAAKPIEIPVEPTVEAREEPPLHEEPPPPPPIKEKAKPVKTKAKAIVREEPKPEPARDRAVVSMFAELESEDPAVVARVARKLEAEAERLKQKEGQTSIKRCAAMSALRAERRELIRCLEQFERLLSEG